MQIRLIPHFPLPFVFLILLLSCNDHKMHIEVLDPELEEVIDPNAKIEILSTGHKWSEGPVWVASEDMLLYSDIPNNTIYSWKEEAGSQIYLKPSGYSGTHDDAKQPGSNGLIIDENGALVLCQHGARQLARMDAPIANPESKFTTIVDSYQNKRFNSPNDVVLSPWGDYYFTDPPYGLRDGVNDPLKELAFQGVFRYKANGETVLLDDKLTRPNGLAFSPDYTRLYVANSDPEKALWMVYDVDSTGNTSNGRIFYDVSERRKQINGNPDGLKVHPNGFIFATGPGGVLIFSEDARLLGVIHTGKLTANCAFDSDHSFLYLTANDMLMRVPIR